MAPAPNQLWLEFPLVIRAVRAERRGWVAFLLGWLKVPLSATSPELDRFLTTSRAKVRPLLKKVRQYRQTRPR
jgi:hypothetical protein